MKQYLELANHILVNGIRKMDRTGTGTTSVFGYQNRCNLQDGFPLLTTKKLFTRAIIHELLWFLRGDTNIKYLQDNGVHIWDAWADENGDLGPVYGYQWRHWNNHDSYGNRMGESDQICNVIQRIKANPDDRRLIVSAWNVAQIDDMALPPCHLLFQFYTRELTFEQRLALMLKKFGKVYTTLPAESFYDDILEEQMSAEGIPTRALDCQLYQRSADLFLGVPYNIASYALLTMMVAQVTGMVAGEFVHTFGDVHIYRNHEDQIRLQLTREPRALPKMVLNPNVKSIFDFKIEDFTLDGYDPHPAITGAVSV